MDYVIDIINPVVQQVQQAPQPDQSQTNTVLSIPRKTYSPYIPQPAPQPLQQQPQSPSVPVSYVPAQSTLTQYVYPNIPQSTSSSSSSTSSPSGKITSMLELEKIVTRDNLVLNPKPESKFVYPTMSNDDGLEIVIREEIQPTWSLLDIVTRAYPEDWHELFHDCYVTFRDIDKNLRENEAIYGRCFPEKKNWFRAFELCPLQHTKVVIIGQDPYPGTNKDGTPIAQGLSFSGARDQSIPRSLQNVYKELQRTIPNWFYPNHGCLEYWARQGVLLLNTCLTINPGRVNSHQGMGWGGFIVKVFKFLAEKRPKTIYMLWGGEAKKLRKDIGEKAIFLEAAHPSPTNRSGGFIGCNHFAEANRILIERGEQPIDWRVF